MPQSHFDMITQFTFSKENLLNRISQRNSDLAYIKNLRTKKAKKKSAGRRKKEKSLQQIIMETPADKLQDVLKEMGVM